MATDNHNYNHALKVGAWSNKMKRAVEAKWSDEQRLADAGLSVEASSEILSAHDAIILDLENNIPTLEECRPQSETELG